jgi:hypothetical protein
MIPCHIKDMSVGAIDPFKKDSDSFIPQSFAQEKLKTASSKYFELKLNYDMHFAQLQQSHDSHCLKTKLFYEEYIKDMKFKAKSQISGQMILHSDLVNNLELQITNSEKDVERLRDQLSSSRLNHQKESRSLKCLLSSAKENERQLEVQRLNNYARYECEKVMAEMLSVIEMKAFSMKEESNMLSVVERLSSIIPPLCGGVGITGAARSQRSLQAAGGQKAPHLRALAVLDGLGAEVARIIDENTATRGIVRGCIELERAIITQHTKLSGLDLPRMDVSPDWENSISSESVSGALIAQEALERGMRELSHLCSKQDEECEKFKVTLARQSENILMLEVDACMQMLLGKVEVLSAPAVPVPVSAVGEGHSDGDNDGAVAVHRCAWCSKRRQSESESLRATALAAAAATATASVKSAESRGDGIDALSTGRADESSKEFQTASCRSYDDPDPAEEAMATDIDSTKLSYRGSTGGDLNVSLIAADRATAGVGGNLSALDATCGAILGAPADSKREKEGEGVKEVDPEEDRSPVTVGVVCRGEYASEVEELEDAVYALQQDLSVASKSLEEAHLDRSALSETLSAVMEEKRTDIIGEYVLEIQALREREERLRESLVSLRASRSKDELYVIAAITHHNTLSF